MTTATLDASPNDYRSAISRFATGVTVITTYDGDHPAGMTASAVTSLSLEPLQLLVCISTHLPTHKLLKRSRRFAVNVLGEGQEELALRFASRDVDRFAGVDLREGWDSPVLADAIAVFDCEVADMLPGGDHSIFVGRVHQCDHDEDARPLVYWASSFGEFQVA